MKNMLLALLILVAAISQPAWAFENNQARIDHYLQVLNSQDRDQQQQMLSRLQWAGLSDPALFDVIEQRLLDHYSDNNSRMAGLMAHHARALGYSGNEKYRPTLALVSREAGSPKVRSHATRALADLDKFSAWWALLSEPEGSVEGQSVEAATWLQMLHTDNVFVQRLAARAIFHEKRTDPVLLEQAAALVEQGYMNDSMDGEAEDTLAWLCKALGENDRARYRPLLQQVAEHSPSAKVVKYARKYSR